MIGIFSYFENFYKSIDFFILSLSSWNIKQVTWSRQINLIVVTHKLLAVLKLILSLEKEFYFFIFFLKKITDSGNGKWKEQDLIFNSSYFNYNSFWGWSSSLIIKISEGFSSFVFVDFLISHVILNF